MMKFGVKKGVIFLSSIVLLGFADLFTTVLGVAFFGAAEVNPLLSGLIQANIPFFIGLKAVAVLLSGFAFYAEQKLWRNHLIGQVCTFVLLTLDTLLA